MTHCMLCTTEDVCHTTVSYISTSARTVLALAPKNVQLTCGSIAYSTSELKWHTVCCVLRTSVIPHFLIFPPVRGQSSHWRQKTYSWRVVVYHIRHLYWKHTRILYTNEDGPRSTWKRVNMLWYNTASRTSQLSYHIFLYFHQCEDSPRTATQKRTADVW